MYLEFPIQFFEVFHRFLNWTFFYLLSYFFYYFERRIKIVKSWQNFNLENYYLFKRLYRFRVIMLSLSTILFWSMTVSLLYLKQHLLFICISNYFEFNCIWKLGYLKLIYNFSQYNYYWESNQHQNTFKVKVHMIDQSVQAVKNLPGTFSISNQLLTHYSINQI